ncbi:hypothetical protein, partial [Klebsiella pneumoniae]|uniref:hypothetical protein n=1 Tax=Klebsiella pneumoniae TaxID=573 RepID=UPI000AC214A4
WLMMSLWDALRMNMMISYQELVRTFPKEHQEYYMDIFMNMMPVKLIHLVAIMSVYMEWHNVNYISDGGKGFADNGAVKKYIEGWKNRHQ